MINGNESWNSYALYTTRIIGLIVHDNQMPNTYTFRQNFPNTFKLSTTINYLITKSSLVIIKVYDLLGCEVVTLANENKSAGNYPVKFNTSSELSSGVCFYKMQAGSFIETKKLLLKLYKRAKQS